MIDKPLLACAMAGALLVALPPPVVEAEPVVVRATSGAERVRQLSAPARRLVEELDGRRRGVHLLGRALDFRTRSDLVYTALEIQAVEHGGNGNYLYALYVALRDHDEATATAWANQLARQGVAIGPASGHFETLAHLDPEEAIPVPSAEVSKTRMLQWVDDFEKVVYRPGYRPFRRGSLSEILQLRYADGTALDIDIRLISDNRDPAPLQSIGRASLGPGDRLFPLRLNRESTPRLWRAKHEHALAGMNRSNREFENMASLGVAAVFSNLPIGLAAPVASGAAQVRVRARGKRAAPGGRGAPRDTPARANDTAGRTGEIPTYSRIVRRPEHPGVIVRAPKVPKAAKAGTSAWPPSPPTGVKPGLHEPNAAHWRYQRYAYEAYRKGRKQSSIMPYATWRERHFEPARRGGRPGRPGSLEHQLDVKRNNKPNQIRGRMIGNRFPDGVGKPGQTLVIRGRKIAPRGEGRVVIVESDHTIRGGTIPNSAARAQMRDIRRAEPGATLVVTDQANPRAAPLIYPPGKQPPPKGRLPKHQAPVVDYP